LKTRESARSSYIGGSDRFEIEQAKRPNPSRMPPKHSKPPKITRSPRIHRNLDPVGNQARCWPRTRQPRFDTAGRRPTLPRRAGNPTVRVAPFLQCRDHGVQPVENCRRSGRFGPFSGDVSLDETKLSQATRRQIHHSPKEEYSHVKNSIMRPYFIAGAGLGAIAALLLAPKSGRELRGDITETTKRSLDSATHSIKEMCRKAGDLYVHGM
jgi:hypothetical protein